MPRPQGAEKAQLNAKGPFNVNVLVIVNASPWGSSLGLAAQRLVASLLDEGVGVPAVFFREEGVYHAVAGRAADAGTPSMGPRWRQLSADHGIDLLICSTASQRRLERAPEGFREAGLAEVLERMAACDRVVSF